MGEDTYYVYLAYQRAPAYSSEKRVSTGKSPTQQDIAFIVKPNSMAQVDVPVGVYKLYYCSGKTWDGIANKFGEDTSYAVADSLLTFYTTEQQYKGNSVELWKQANGNLSEQKIDGSEFPG